MLVFAQVHVDAGAEVSTKYVVHEFERYLIGIVERRRELRSQNQTLTRAGPIEEIDDIFSRFWSGRNILFRNFAGLPGCKKSFQLGSDFGQGDIANDEQSGVVALNGSQTIFLQTSEFFFRKSGMQNEVSINFERFVDIGLECIEIDGGEIQICAGGELSAE